MTYFDITISILYEVSKSNKHARFMIQLIKFSNFFLQDSYDRICNFFRITLFLNGGNLFRILNDTSEISIHEKIFFSFKRLKNFSLNFLIWICDNPVLDILICEKP